MFFHTDTADVPWTVYFKRPYAIHASYWHEDFGQRKSGGCVNLSPIDGRRLFAWTEPRLPAGWHAMRGIKTDAEAIEMAYKAEVDTMKFFSDAMRNTNLPEGKDIFKELIDQEKEHIRMLDSVRASRA